MSDRKLKQVEFIPARLGSGGQLKLGNTIIGTLTWDKGSYYLIRITIPFVKENIDKPFKSVENAINFMQGIVIPAVINNFYEN